MRNLILVETHEPFQHHKFHDGWWKIMITQGIRLWLALFSRIWHSIDTSNRYVLWSQTEILFGYQFYVNQWTHGSAMLMTIVFEKQDHIFDIKWSLHCFSYTQGLLFFSPLEVSAYAPTFHLHNTATTIWDAFFVIFSPPLLWVSDLHWSFSCQTAHKLELDKEPSHFYW